MSFGRRRCNSTGIILIGDPAQAQLERTLGIELIGGLETYGAVQLLR